MPLQRRATLLYITLTGQDTINNFLSMELIMVTIAVVITCRFQATIDLMRLQATRSHLVLWASSVCILTAMHQCTGDMRRLLCACRPPAYQKMVVR